MQRRSARIAGELEAEILSGRLPSGERLPSEEKLCERFGASRTLIREAIQQLRGCGLLRTLKGSGTYIATPSLESLGHAITAYSTLAEHADFLDLIDFRILIESECARLVADRAGARTIERLRTTLEAMERARGSQVEFSKADIAFHTALAQASGNGLYATLLSALEKRAIEFVQSNRGEGDWYGGVIDQHRAIFREIEAARSGAAAEAMRRHLLESRRQFIDHG